jgi:hypothetical protein
MGYDAACTLRFEGREDRGTAWLEHKDLIFRGPNRLAIPLNEITEACAEGGTLHVRFAGKRAAFEIGAAAAKWADRITKPPSRLDKLGIKPGMQVALVGAVEADFEREVAARGAAVSRLVPAGAQRADAVFYLATARADLARVPSLSRALAPGGALWILRPKGRPEISEADTMAAGKKAGLVDVKVVSFSETHSAEKYMVRRSAPPSRASSNAIKPAAKRARSRRSSSPSPRKS